MPSVIDTHPKRQQIIDALLAGQSLRKVAKVAGVSHTQVAEYKNTVLTPALQTALNIQRMNALAQNADPQEVNVSEVTTLTKLAAESNIFLERADELWEVTREGVRDAKEAVEVVTLKDGKQVPVGRSFNALALMLNQAHRNLELFGKGTKAIDGERNNGPQVVVVINNNAAPATAEDLQIHGAITIDTRAEK